MKVLLVYCNTIQQNALPMGITQLSSCLKEAGIEVVLFDTTFYKYREKSSMEVRYETLQFKPVNLKYNEGDIYADFLKTVETVGPDIIGFSVVEPTFIFSLSLLGHVLDIIKKRDIKVVYGGVFATLAPEVIAKHDNIDCICTCEGEIVFVESCNNLKDGNDVTEAKGFWVKVNDVWKKNPKSQLVDISALPMKDYAMFGDDYLLKPMMGEFLRTVSLEVSRGCPYSCTYCAAPVLDRNAKSENTGSYHRLKSISKIDEEMRHFMEIYKPHFIYIVSESFLAVSQKRIDEFYECYSNYRIPFWFNTRPEDITERKIRLMKDLGVQRISLGIESGNYAFRKRVLRRNTTDEQIIKASEILHDHDISFSMNIIFGYPDETREMILEGIDIFRKVSPDGVSTAIFNPYHGTPLRQVCLDKGYISDDLICEDFYQKEYLLNGNTVTREDVIGLYKTYPLYIHLPKSEYPRIKIAERDDVEGNKVFAELREMFYEIMKWDTAALTD